ncbi:MAG: hypothetical protein ABW133_02705 [Polyangiaceae bacterium]
MRKVLIGLFALSSLAGCASTELCPETPANASLEHLTLRHPGSFEQVALDGARMFGPDLEVMRYDDGYRGFAYRRQIDLRVQDNRIEGVVGAGRTELHLLKFSDGFGLYGLYAGNLGRLNVHRNHIEGHLGGRVLNLRNSPEAPLVYESNSGPAEQAVALPRAPTRIHAGPTEMVLPENFGSLPTEDQAALLAIFLGR